MLVVLDGLGVKTGGLVTTGKGDPGVAEVLPPPPPPLPELFGDPYKASYSAILKASSSLMAVLPAARLSAKPPIVDRYPASLVAKLRAL